MAFVESQWWLLELPNEWQASQEEDAIVVADQDGVGELIITTLQKESGLVSDDELMEYARDTLEICGGAAQVEVADAVGLYCCFEDAGEYVREWYLRHQDLFLYITYCCDAEDAAMDDAAIDEILATLCFRLQPESS